MSDWYTPTTATLREAYWRAQSRSVAEANAQFDRWLSAIQSATRETVIREAKAILRGEGEPGHAGESISVNHAQELLDDLLEEQS